jgi:hypothetical protein
VVGVVLIEGALDDEVEILFAAQGELARAESARGERLADGGNRVGLAGRRDAIAEARRMSASDMGPSRTPAVARGRRRGDT